MALFSQRKLIRRLSSQNSDCPVDNRHVARIGNYILGETLGSGAFGKVKVGRHQITNVQIAIKMINKQNLVDKKIIHQIKREVVHQKALKHPHITEMFNVICGPRDVFLLMEYVDGGTLFDYINEHGKLDSHRSLHLFQQLISGVDFLHRRGIIHRDLKLENLLIDLGKKNIKITDFGLSNLIKDGACLLTCCGSPNYAAPEIIGNRPYAGPEVDVWSCGIILFVLLCGFLPFDNPDQNTLHTLIQGGFFPIPRHLEFGAVDLLKKMITVDQIRRTTVSKIIVHTWFRRERQPLLFGDYNSKNNGGDILAHQLFFKAIEYVSDKLSISEVDIQRAIRTNKSVKINMIRSKENQEQSKESTKENEGNESMDHDMENIEHAVVGLNLYDVSDEEIAAAEFQVLSKLLNDQGVRSYEDSVDVMTAVYNVLLTINLKWKVVSPYCVILVIPDVTLKSSNTITLQLFTLATSGYILDFMLNNYSNDPRHTVKNEHQHGTPSTNSSQNDPMTSVMIKFLDVCYSIVLKLVPA